MTQQELKVLLIEDNPGDAFLMKFYLSESTTPVFNVSHAETVKAALDLLAVNKFDLILSDMNLPDSFGFDTIKTVLAKYPGNLVIVLTGLTDEQVGLETVRYGAQDFLVKGKFDGKVLISSVMFAFERFKLNKQLDSVSKKLDEENSRIEAIQQMLNVGYLEIDMKSRTVYRSDYMLRMTGLTAEQRISSIENAIDMADNQDELKQKVKEAFEKQGSGEFSYSRKDTHKKYHLVYQCKDHKFLAVVKEVF